MKVALVFASLFLAVLAGPSDPEPRPDQWWVDRHNSFVSNTISNPATPIIFYGDSITEGWGGSGAPVFNEHFAPLGVANYGIGGDQVQHVLWRIINGEVEGLNPKLIVLKIGTNNLGGHTDREIADGIGKIISTIRSMLPNTKVLLLSVLPRTGEANFAKIANINIFISKFHDGVNVFYQNIFDNMAQSWGVVDLALFPDGLHLSTPGYQLWYDIMSPWFYALIQ